MLRHTPVFNKSSEHPVTSTMVKAKDFVEAQQKVSRPTTETFLIQQKQTATRRISSRYQQSNAYHCLAFPESE